jgi:dynamin 1-like protein
MDSLIPIVNKLQDVFGGIGQQSLNLPQITVVGSQSAGKSSVLENIVGRDFLPRGTGIVTRRPLVLQLHCLGTEVIAAPAEESARGEEWGEFLHLPGQRFYDFAEIKEEISRETDRVTGTNKGISNKSINLKIFSPHVLTLTLVDLPGITKVPTGDQPEDVEDQIRSMCLEFISNPNAIILAVTAANQDLANSDGIKLARTVDPDGERTVGVLTKVDIMDHGTDASEILNNRVIPLRRGYIAVVNRSQKEIKDNRSIRDGLKKEYNYFQTHPRYRTMPSKCGTQNLARTLNQILHHHIRDTLPEIKSKIAGLLAEVQKDIDALGEPTHDQNVSKLGATLLNLLSKFASAFEDSIDGRGTSDGRIEMAELYGGARIRYIFNEIFGKSLKTLDPFEGLDDADILTAIDNANGPRNSLFVPEIAFDLLVKRQIARLEQPGLQCVDLVFTEMQRVAQQAENTELCRFPGLRDRLFEIVNESLRAHVLPTQKMISNLVSVELAYINTSHPDFIGGREAARMVQEDQAAQKRSREQGQQVQQQQQQQQHNRPPAPPANVLALANTPHNEAFKENIASAAQADDQIKLGAASGGSRSSSSSSNITRNNGAKSGSFDSFKTPQGPGYFDLFKNGNAQQSVVSGESKLPPRREGELVKLGQVPDRMRSSRSGAPQYKQMIETNIIKKLISSYFDVVKKNFLDLVPKTIMHFLVNNFKGSLQTELVSQLYKDTLMNDLMRETEDIAARRKRSQETRACLQRALEIVNEVRDFNSYK